MSNLVKTYILAPNFHLTPPPDGPIALGSIITSPSTPERIVNKTTRIPFPTHSIYTSHQSNWESTREALSEAKLGVWTSFLQVVLGINVDATAKRTHHANEVYRCERLETTYFHPDDEYIYESLNDTMVKSYMEKTCWGKPVYLITGLKIARGMIAESYGYKKYGGVAKIGVDGTVGSGGVPVSGGPIVEGEMEKCESVRFKTSSDFVFAYRLVRIKLWGKEGGFKEADYNKGALYSADDRDGAINEIEKGKASARGLREAFNIDEVDGSEGVKDVTVISLARDDLL